MTMSVEKEILKLCRKADELRDKCIFLKKTSDIIEQSQEISRTDLYRKCYFADKKKLDSFIKILVKEGKIKVWRNIGTVKQAEQIEWILSKQ
jgi:hypothetical protein